MDPLLLKMKSDIRKDLAEEEEEVLCRRIPLTSLRGFRSACKKMNPLFRSFTKKKKKKHLAKVKKMSNLRKDLVLCKRIPVRGFRSVCKKRNLLSRDRSFTKKKKKKLPAKLTKVSDLPKDLTEEILSRLPLTSVRALRSACKKWNTLSKDPSFTRKHLLAQAKAAAEAARDFDLMVVMVIDFKVFLTTINIHKGSVDHQGKLISLENSNQVDISQVFHCGGLVLCITRDYSRFVVWNPYSCETLWLEPTSPDHPRLDWYLFAIGYDENSRNYKVLRFVDGFEDSVVEYEIYDLNNSTSSWRVLDVASDWYIFYFARGVSVKGNTYWFAVEKKRSMVEFADFLICFDFTRERFGPRLRLPFFPHEEDTVTLSSVREEQLAVLFQPWDSLHMDIWVTTRIEPHLVSWSKLWSLAVNMEPLIGFQFGITSGSFFIDQENKVVVVFEKDKGRYTDRMVRHNTAYFIGEDGYFREVDLGETSELHICPLGCSYVPSSVQIKQRGGVIY